MQILGIGVIEMDKLNEQQTVSNPIEHVVMWLKLSLNWILKGRRRCKAVIDNQLTQSAVNVFKKNLWLTKFRYQPNHWAHRDFKSMCCKRINLIEDANKDL